MALFHRFHRRASSHSALQQSENRAGAPPIRQRRYLNTVPYFLPKDLLESSRLDFQHHLLQYLLGNHFVAPLEPGIHDILDVGSGTGRWGHDMARLLPHSRVIGLDIEAAPVHTLPAPTNYRFIQGDLLKGLPFESMSFDFVHQRLLVAAIPSRQWLQVISELVRVTRPGGWIEVLEVGDTFEQAGPQTQRLMNWCGKAMQQKGFDLALMSHLDELLSQTGGCQVQQRTLRVPIGCWGGRAGELLATNMQAGLAGMKELCCSHAAVSPSEFDRTLARLPQEWEQHHTTYQFFVAYGQRGT